MSMSIHVNDILIIHEQQIYKARTDVIDCPHKEFSVIKLNQMKKVNDKCSIFKVNMSATKLNESLIELNNILKN